MKVLGQSALALILVSHFGSAFAASNQKLDTTTFVVVGGGLAAGMSDLVLTAESQAASFPALLARQMDAIMPLPQFREGGTAAEIAYESLGGNLPAPAQSSLRAIPFPLFTLNLSIPLIKVSESLERRASGPLIVEGDIRASFFNLILGYPVLLFPDAPSWSQIEYATLMAPTFVIVELGFGDVAECLLSGDPERITPVSSFQSDYATIIRRLKGTYANLLLMNVPDPTDTAYASTPAEVSRLYHLDESDLLKRFNLDQSDLVTPAGLEEIGDVMSGRSRQPLSPASVIKGATAGSIRAAVTGYNAAIAALGSADGLPVFDTNALYKEIRQNRVNVGGSIVGGGYAAGFYSQDAIFPTRLGQAIVANRLLEFINSTYRTSFQLLSFDQFQDRPGTTAAPSRRQAGREVQP